MTRLFVYPFENQNCRKFERPDNCSSVWKDYTESLHLDYTLQDWRRRNIWFFISI